MKLSKKSIFQFSFLSLIFLLIGSTFNALAAANSVPVSYADDVTLPIDQNQFFPSQCAGMSLDNTIYGTVDASGVTTINGTNGNDLIYGTDGDDKIYGGNGNDCIVGGGGNNEIYGENGKDVLIGGSGYNFIDGGNGRDVCYFGDVVVACETIY